MADEKTFITSIFLTNIMDQATIEKKICQLYNKFYSQNKDLFERDKREYARQEKKYVDMNRRKYENK